MRNAPAANGGVDRELLSIALDHRVEGGGGGEVAINAESQGDAPAAEGRQANAPVQPYPEPNATPPPPPTPALVAGAIEPVITWVMAGYHKELRERRGLRANQRFSPR